MFRSLTKHFLKYAHISNNTATCKCLGSLPLPGRDKCQAADCRSMPEDVRTLLESLCLHRDEGALPWMSCCHTSKLPCLSQSLSPWFKSLRKKKSKKGNKTDLPKTTTNPQRPQTTFRLSQPTAAWFLQLQ